MSFVILIIIYITEKFAVGDLVPIEWVAVLLEKYNLN